MERNITPPTQAQLIWGSTIKIYSINTKKYLPTNHNPFLESAAVSEVDNLAHSCTKFNC